MTVLGWIIFWLSIGASTSLIKGVWKDKNDESQTFPTWLLYFILETILMLFTNKLDGNFPIIFGSSVGSFIMMCILAHQGRFSWSWRESVLVIFVIACLIIQHFSGYRHAIIAGLFAQTAIGTHLIYKTYKSPRVKYNLWGYILFFIVGILSMYNSDDFSVEEFWYSFIEVVLDFIILIPLIRKWYQSEIFTLL